MTSQKRLIDFIKTHDVLAFDDDAGVILYADDCGYFIKYDYFNQSMIPSTSLTFGDRDLAIRKFLNSGYN